MCTYMLHSACKIVNRHALIQTNIANHFMNLVAMYDSILYKIAAFNMHTYTVEVKKRNVT